jgi:dethiobiotin synthetase
MTRGFFVAGTDTGVGKTLVSCALLHAAANAGLRAVGMKPVAAGCRPTPAGLRNADAEALLAATNVPAEYDDVNPVALPLATSPDLAARAAGIEIEIGRIRTTFLRLASRADLVIVEGAGGWYAPIAPRRTMADIARAVELPVLLVVGMRLGCLSHARLTAEAIARAGLTLAGVIANHMSADPVDAGYAASLAAHVGTAPIVEIPYGLAKELEHSMRALTALIDSCR